MPTVFWVALMGCRGITISPDETETVEESDADTGADTDSDTDTEADYTGIWQGAITGANEDAGAGFCAGDFSVEVSASGELDGEGVCVVLVGPGKGIELGMTMAAVLTEGSIEGSVVVEMEPASEVDVEGFIDDDTMSLSWVFEVPAGGGPGNGPQGAAPGEMTDISVEANLSR